MSTTTTKVSHTLTVTESGTTPSVQATGKLSCSIGAFRTKDVLLMFLEVVIPITCFMLMASSETTFNEMGDATRSATLAFTLCLFIFFLATSLLLISHLISPMAAEVLPKTSFQFLHNLFAFLFYLLSSLAYVILISQEHHKKPTRQNEVAASVLGVGNAACYFFSTFFAYKSFKSS